MGQIGFVMYNLNLLIFKETSQYKYLIKMNSHTNLTKMLNYRSL